MNRYILTLFTLLVMNAQSASAGDKKESVYDRVMKSGTIRCGYIAWPPLMEIDSATGKFSGMNYDYANAVADILGLTIDWALEVMPGSQVEALRSGKIDAICAADGPMVPSTVKYVHYSEPYAYFPVFLYARATDKRFIKGLAEINDPDIRIAVIDGDVSGQVAALQFPKATQYTMPQLSAPGQMMLDVAGGKADIVVNDPFSMKSYMDNNPEKLRTIPTNGPIAVIPNTFSVLRGDETGTFLNLLNQGIETLRNYNGERQIFDRYQKTEDRFFYPVVVPYMAEKK